MSDNGTANARGGQGTSTSARETRKEVQKCGKKGGSWFLQESHRKCTAHHFGAPLVAELGGPVNGGLASGSALPATWWRLGASSRTPTRRAAGGGPPGRNGIFFKAIFFRLKEKKYRK
jgi:hypothetical protein